jgi:phage terminase large subunit
VQANWRDNPWFPNVLEDERRHDFEQSPDNYEHVWEGGYVEALEGSYFGKLLAEARTQGRIGRVTADPLLPLRAYVDIGGSGANADAFVIWIVQFVGQEIRILDYYESVGQVLGEHLHWMRSKGYGRAIVRLPHDGVKENDVLGKRYEDLIRSADFQVDPSVPNQGRGAASMRIEAVRRILPKCWFNETTTEAGRDALGFYHERKDEARLIGLGPDHDWSSHAADAFGLMAICYEEPSRTAAFSKPIKYPTAHVA